MSFRPDWFIVLICRSDTTRSALVTASSDLYTRLIKAHFQHMSRQLLYGSALCIILLPSEPLLAEDLDKSGNSDKAEHSVSLTEEEKEWLNAQPKIVLGIDAAWKTATKVGKKSGTNIQLKRGTWPDLVEQAKAHEIDGLVSSAATEERRAYFLFRKSYMEFKEYVYTSRTANFKIDEIQDPKGRRVAIQKENVFGRNIAETIEDVTIVEFATDA
jgi:ABC-type amino acid transport substrate-binding protein